jgi:hypothetical protein
MFKTIIGAILLVGVMYIIVDATFNNDVVYMNEVTTEVETVEINVLEKRINEAIEAEESAIEAKAQEAYNKVIEAEKTKIRNEVKLEYIREIESSLSSE